MADKHIASPSQARKIQNCSGCYYDRLKQTQYWIKSESRERTWSGLVLKKKKEEKINIWFSQNHDLSLSYTKVILLPKD